MFFCLRNHSFLRRPGQSKLCLEFLVSWSGKRVTLFNLEGVRREIEGDIAQLGERLPCKQEVAGSNPTISTKRIKRHLVQDEGP